MGKYSVMVIFQRAILNGTGVGEIAIIHINSSFGRETYNEFGNNTESRTIRFLIPDPSAHKGMLAVFIINNGKIDNPDSKALSHKTKRYYHKNGKYVKPGMRVMKNVAQWYTKANYKGTSHKKVTYSIYEQA